MCAIDLVAAALPSAAPPAAPAPGLCCVLGREGDTVPRHLAIRPSFTNLDLLRAPASDRVSLEAWRVLTYAEPGAEGKKRDRFPLMQSSWIARETGLTWLDRLAARALVLGMPEQGTAWAGYVTTSYKKHGVLRAPVNRGAQARWLFELDVVDCSDRDRVGAWWERLAAARLAGVPRGVLETLDISVPLLAKHAALWRDFEPWARARVRAPLYRFLCYLLPGEEELRAQRD